MRIGHTILLGFAVFLCLLGWGVWGHGVIISEFMAENDTTLRDDLGGYSDWIELYNDGASNANLTGWYLTDDADDLTKWQFPSNTIVEPGSFLVLFASGEDRTNGTLHTNFRLADQGEYLALVKPNGVTVADEFAPRVSATGRGHLVRPCQDRWRHPGGSGGGLHGDCARYTASASGESVGRARIRRHRPGLPLLRGSASRP